MTWIFIISKLSRVYVFSLPQGATLNDIYNININYCIEFELMKLETILVLGLNLKTNIGMAWWYFWLFAWTFTKFLGYVNTKESRGDIRFGEVSVNHCCQLAMLLISIRVLGFLPAMAGYF